MRKRVLEHRSPKNLAAIEFTHKPTLTGDKS
jgi:hypothetical protein